MNVDQITIDGYRSLYHVDFRPQAFSTIVGPNNAGKSNLLDAIHFLGEVHRHGIDVAVSRKGGFENIAFRHQRRTKRPIGFTVCATLDAATFKNQAYLRRRVSPNLSVRIEHSFSIGAASQKIDADFFVVHEAIKLTVHQGRGPIPVATVIADRQREGGNERVEIDVKSTIKTKDSSAHEMIEPFDDPSFRDFVQRNLLPGQLLLNTLRFNTPLLAFGRELSATRLHQLAAIECRRPGVPTPVPELELHGGNLPALVEYLQRNHKNAWSQVLNAMRHVVPNLDDVKTTYTTDRRLALQFRETGLSRPWSAEDISDGTIQSLAMFCVLFDPRSRLTLIEEPENSVHPWIIRTFAEACRTVTGKQVVVTTHSPVLLNHLSPEEVMVAFKSDGRTQLASMEILDPDAHRLWSSGRGTVFEILDSGALPQAVPGE